MNRLALVNDVDAVALLVMAFDDDDARVRWAAVRVLGLFIRNGFRHRGSIPALAGDDLRRLLNDADERVRDEARFVSSMLEPGKSLWPSKTVIESFKTPAMVVGRRLFGKPRIDRSGGLERFREYDHDGPVQCASP